MLNRINCQEVEFVKLSKFYRDLQYFELNKEKRIYKICFNTLSIH